MRKLPSIQFRHELVRACGSTGRRRAEHQNRRPELLKAFQLYKNGRLSDPLVRLHTPEESRHGCVGGWVCHRAHTHPTTSWPRIAAGGHSTRDERDRPWVKHNAELEQ